MNEQPTKPSRSPVQTFVLLVATALGIYVCYRLSLPFLSALAWALALGVLFSPFQGWVESKIRHPNLSASLSVLMIGLIVVVPAIFIGQRLAVEAVKGAQLIDTAVSSGEWRAHLQNQPRLAPWAEKIEQQMDLPGTVRSLVTWLSTTIGFIVRGSVFQVLDVCLTFYLLFFFLRDRWVILEAVSSLSPLSEGQMHQMFKRVGDTIHATIYGTLAVSAFQGLLGGLMFWRLGLPAPLFWGVVMAVLAVVPVLGASVVWIPAALFLAMEGSLGKALMLTLWGILIVGTIDNLMWPVLVGQRLRLHTVLAFIAVVGGLALFGPAGLVLGPVALTVTVTLLEVWSEDASSGSPNSKTSRHSQL